MFFSATLAADALPLLCPRERARATLLLLSSQGRFCVRAVSRDWFEAWLKMIMKATEHSKRWWWCSRGQEKRGTGVTVDKKIIEKANEVKKSRLGFFSRSVLPSSFLCGFDLFAGVTWLCKRSHLGTLGHSFTWVVCVCVLFLSCNYYLAFTYILMEHLERVCVCVLYGVVNTIGINWHFPSHSECVSMVALIMMSRVNDDEWLSNYCGPVFSHSMFMLI